jgi:hypothetical protein
MKLQNIIITEELKMKTRDETINSLFEKTLPQVFSPIMIKKIDRVFDGVIEPTEYSEKTTVVAYTKGNKIYVNTKNFYSIEPDKAIIYVLHEFCHLLQNQKAFYDLKKVNNDLYYCAMPYLRIWKVSKFLTGKTQNIHSDYKQEFLTYLMNNSEQINMLPENVQKEYFSILERSGLFNMSSSFWKIRFKKVK